jgi:hypothetical protein
MKMIGLANFVYYKEVVDHMQNEAKERLEDIVAKITAIVLWWWSKPLF